MDKENKQKKKESHLEQRMKNVSFWMNMGREKLF